MSRRWIMHVDMDAFYASVEQRDFPKLQHKPVIVGGLSLRGVVATASYEARKYGVHSAMPITQARLCCPEGIFRRPRMDVYREVSAQINQIFTHYTPFVEPLSLDEAFLDISGMEKLYSRPYDIGMAIKKEILAEAGLKASVGIAPNKFLAKIASDLQKPDALLVIPYGKEKEFLRSLPIQRLWGVGQKMEEKLRHAGFSSIGDIQKLASFQALLPICGSQAEKIYALAQGIDERPVEFERKIQSVGNEETYTEDLTDPSMIDNEWRYFAHRVAKRLRQQQLTCHTVTIKVRFSDFHTITKQITVQNAVDDEDTLYLLATTLYNKIKTVRPIRLLGLTAGHFDTRVYQDSLFAQDVDKSNLIKAMDSLEEKFGEEVVKKGFLLIRENIKSTKR